jgi:methyl-accepting chemotaxis protein
MKNILAALSISRKIWLIVSVAMLSLTCLGGYLLVDKRATLEAEKRLATQHVVESAHGVLAHFQAQEAAGKLTREQAQAQAIAAVKALRYDEKEYFWINDMHPVMVMHPFKPELDGKDLSTAADPAGKKLFVEFVETVKRSGAGFVAYQWPKPGADKPVPKISYVKGFAPWGWVIGSGIYVDDVEAAFWRSTQLVGGFLALILLMIGAVATLLIRRITRPLADAVRIAEGVAAGNLDLKVADADRDEVGALLVAMRTMQDSLKSFVAAQVEMKTQHDAGAISYRIDVQRFAGCYAKMAEQVNELVATHIAVKMRVVEVVQKYANGDLSADIEDMPGEKARITEAIRGVKRSLQSINTEIANLVTAAVGGDFKVRGDVDKYQHDFRAMVEGLNRLMEVSDQGLNEVSRVLGALARGDLTETITNEYEGTFRQLKDDSNKTVAQLSEIVGQIREATESINSVSTEIAKGNSDLSNRTEQQASSLEETASSMEELTSTVKQNAENAKQANQLAIGASAVAVKGGQVVSEVVDTMGSINESSKKIVDIISVIDGIAFQTNILALNAAVEAARAGEQGRGFAVVATEVRNLAQRSAAAAKEIKSLISDSVEKVGSGTKLVDQAGKTMEEIVTSIKRVTDIMSEITAASQEQSAGIEQVNSAITQMDDVTQQNAALVEEAAAAAESMQEQAQALAQSVSVFRVDAGASVAERRAPTRASNVERLPGKAARPAVAKSPPRAKTGTDDEWSEF